MFSNTSTLPPMAETQLTARQRQILEVIERHMRDRGYPPSVREIGEAVGLTSPSTVHNHLASLQRLGLPAARPHQARAPSRSASTRLRCRRRAPAGPPRAARRRRRRRHRRARPGERRGGPARCRPTSRARATCSCCASGATRWSTPASSTATSSSPASRPRAEHGRRRRGRHPGRRGHGQDLQPQRRPRSCSLPANSRLGPMVFEPDDVQHLRASRHGLRRL